jgi:translation initiation factor 1
MSGRRLVYSTDHGRIRPAATAAAPPAPARPDGVVRISRERAGRGGKTVTVIRGLSERGAALAARAAGLRRLCGTGGTVRDEAIELQGDHRARVAEHLTGLGARVKLAGG